MLMFKTGVAAKLLNANQLLFVFPVVFPDLGQQAPTGTAALAGDALYIFGVYANSLDFHGWDCFVSGCKFNDYYWINTVILAMLDKTAILNRLIW